MVRRNEWIVELTEWAEQAEYSVTQSDQENVGMFWSGR
jgi:hypothetical protein